MHTQLPVGIPLTLVVAHACLQVEPGVFRDLHTFMQSSMKGKGRVEVLSFAVTAEGATADEFAASSSQQQVTRASLPTPEPGATVLGSPSHSIRRELPAAVAPVAVPAAHRGSHAAVSSGGEVVYARGPIAELPEAHASRRERFAELDNLQPGWQVELRTKGDTVEAVFFAPGTGELVGAFANARRMALAAKKAAGQ